MTLHLKQETRCGWEQRGRGGEETLPRVGLGTHPGTRGAAAEFRVLQGGGGARARRMEPPGGTADTTPSWHGVRHVQSARPRTLTRASLDTRLGPSSQPTCGRPLLLDGGLATAWEVTCCHVEAQVTGDACRPLGPLASPEREVRPSPLGLLTVN